MSTKVTIVNTPTLHLYEDVTDGHVYLHAYAETSSARFRLSRLDLAELANEHTALRAASEQPDGAMSPWRKEEP